MRRKSHVPEQKILRGNWVWRW